MSNRQIDSWFTLHLSKIVELCNKDGLLGVEVVLLAAGYWRDLASANGIDRLDTP